MIARIHALQNEIRAIEGILDNLSGPMLDMALEEMKNLKFELDMLNRTMQRSKQEELMEA